MDGWREVEGANQVGIVVEVNKRENIVDSRTSKKVDQRQRHLQDLVQASDL